MRGSAFTKALALIKEGLSPSAIGKELGVSVDQVRYWLKGGKPKRAGRYSPDLTPSKDLAYVSGFYLGDGKYAGEEHKVRFELADGEQLEYVGTLVAKILGRPPKPLKRDGTFYTVDYDSVVLSTFLDQEVGALVEYLREFASDFLQGFFDAEGYVTCSVDVGRMSVSKVWVGAANADQSYLSIVNDLVSRFGICGRTRRTNRAGTVMAVRGRHWVRRRDVYHLEISRVGDVLKFQKAVGFRSPQKAWKLSDFVEMLLMPRKARFAWFQAHYTKKGRKWVRIAK